tara:strand:- start:1519 stop:2394 length:876 start_codon:yes stop_codon:yes gene_type:complete
MIFKSYIIEQNIENIKKFNVFLFYGENQGLKKDFKEQIKNYYNNNEILNLFQEEILKNSSLLVNEIKNKSLFNDEKIIFINEANDKIVSIVDDLFNIIKDEKIFIFADNLEKRSKLRNIFEKSKDCGVVPCYQDNEITIRKIVSSELTNFKGLTPEIINTIIQNTGLNRDKIHNEIEKIKSCFKEKIIDTQKLEQLLNIKVNENFNALKDEALKGNQKNTNRLLADTIFEFENSVFYLNLINQRVNKLFEIEDLKKDNSNLEMIIANLKPPIFWKDKPIIIDQAKNGIKIN